MSSTESPAHQPTSASPIDWDTQLGEPPEALTLPRRLVKAWIATPECAADFARMTGWAITPGSVVWNPRRNGYDKSPITRWRGGAPTDPDVIQRLWEEKAHVRPDSGVRAAAIAVDVKTSRLVVLDFDRPMPPEHPLA